MKPYLFCVVLGLMAGCAGKSTLSGDEKTRAEQLDATVPSWCRITCDRIQGCSDAAAGDHCLAECEAEMARFTGGRDGCAEVGERFKHCIDGMTCEELTHNGACVLSEGDKRLCPESDDSVDVPDGTVDGPPAPGSGGSGPLPGGGPGTGSGTAGGGGGPIVSCNSAYGAVSASRPEPASSAVICEEGRAECDDGHDYSWMCVRGSEGQLGCTCFVDSQVTGGFDPQSSSCPSEATVAAGCHWNFRP